jgi:CBS-domain-containing membrane protein
MSPRLFRILAHAIGGAIGIALMLTIAQASGEPLMMVPFATSIVLVMGAPESPPARPRAILGGHLISATSGVLVALALGDGWWVAAIGVGVAIAVMQALDAFHPPAGISPIIATTAHAPLSFIVSPVAIGALILVTYAWLFHRLAGERWPERWL